MKKFVLITFMIIATMMVTFFTSCSKDEVAKNNSQSSETPVAKTANRLAYGQQVKLIKVSEEKTLGSFSRYFEVEISNLSSNKLVTIYHKMRNNTWQDFGLQFSRYASNGNEIWVGTFQEPFEGYADKFAVKYTVNGITYWDNNGGNNYTFLQSETPAVLFGNNINVLKTNDVEFFSIGGASTIFQVKADVRNIAYQKEVKVIYTTDNWATNQTFYLGYNLTPYANTNFENWTGFTELSSTVNRVEFAIVYKVNGVEYWDNNYGKNYVYVK